MARTALDQATDLRAVDVIHNRFTALPADATVADVRDWFAASSHRQMAFLVDGALLGVIGVTEDLAAFCGT